MEIKEQLIEFYNKNVDIRESTEKTWWKKILRARFLELLYEKNLNNFLELGAGTGQDSLFFMENGMDVTCIDLSTEHIKKCKKKNLNAILMDLYNMDFEDNSFKGIYAMNCLLHVPKKDLSRVLKEIKRVLSDEGILFIGNYGGKNFEAVKETTNGKGLRFFSSSDYNVYKQMLLEEGLYILESGIIESNKKRSFNFFILGKNMSGS